MALGEEIMEKCGIVFRGHAVVDPIDGSSCLKESGHTDHHVFKDKHGCLIAWEDDYSCTCGCWDDYEDTGDTPCMKVWEVKNINE